MLDEKQKNWLCDKCDALLLMAGNYQLTDQQSDALMVMANRYFSQAKGNEEVKSAILATMDYIDKMSRIMR